MSRNTLSEYKVQTTIDVRNGGEKKKFFNVLRIDKNVRQHIDLCIMSIRQCKFCDFIIYMYIICDIACLLERALAQFSKQTI